MALLRNAWNYVKEQFSKRDESFLVKTKGTSLIFHSQYDSKISKDIPQSTSINVYDRSGIVPLKVGTVQIHYPGIERLNDRLAPEPTPQISYKFKNAKAGKKHAPEAVETALKYVRQMNYGNAQVHVASKEHDVANNLDLKPSNSNFNPYLSTSKDNSYEINFRPGVKGNLFKREHSLSQQIAPLLTEQPDQTLMVLKTVIDHELANRQKTAQKVDSIDKAENVLPPYEPAIEKSDSIKKESDVLQRYEKTIEKIDRVDRYLSKGKVVKLTDAQRRQRLKKISPTRRLKAKKIDTTLKQLDKLIDSQPQMIAKLEKVVAREHQLRKKAILKDVSKLLADGKHNTLDKVQTAIDRQEKSKQKSKTKQKTKNQGQDKQKQKPKSKKGKAKVIKLEVDRGR